MLQLPLARLTCQRIYPTNLLPAGVIITSNNNHRRLLPTDSFGSPQTEAYGCEWSLRPYRIKVPVFGTWVLWPFTYPSVRLPVHGLFCTVVPLKKRFSRNATMEPSTTPVCVIGEIPAGRCWKSDGESVGMRPEATETATTKRSFGRALKSTVDNIRMPFAATIPNITKPAPPSTGCGMTATRWPSFGRSPRKTRIAPPVAHTKRERTPVTVTNPTFCE